MNGSTWDKATSWGFQSSSEGRTWNTSKFMQMAWTGFPQKCSLQRISTEHVQNTEHAPLRDYFSSLLPSFWSTAMPCPFWESLQDASTDSEQYFSQNRTYGRFDIHCQKKEKIKKPGLFKVINFASWVQLLITGGGGERSERKSMIISLQHVGSFHSHN